MEKGLLIVIDGLDGTGKQTQSEILYNTLTQEGLDVKKISFPVYESPSGQIIKDYLKGDISVSSGYDYLYDENIRLSMLYANDRMLNMFKKDENGKTLVDYYNEGYIIICDRYTQSNYLYMTKDMDDLQFESYIHLMEWLEYEIMRLPRPDLTIFLKMTPEKSLSLIEKRGEEKDNHETKEILSQAYTALEQYERQCYMNKREDVVIIDCLYDDDNGDTQIKSIEDISKLIFDSIQTLQELRL